MPSSGHASEAILSREQPDFNNCKTIKFYFLKSNLLILKYMQSNFKKNT